MRVKDDFIEVAGGGETTTTTGEANSHPSSAWGAGRGSQVFRVGVQGREIVGKSRASGKACLGVLSPTSAFKDI